MKQRNFWVGFVVAMAGAAWFFWQRQQQVEPPPLLVGSPPKANTPAQKEVDAKAGTPRKPAQEEAQPQPDPLEEVQGIGPVYAGRLHAAQVYTFAQLAELSPERLREITGARSWTDVESWIEQARAKNN